VNCIISCMNFGDGSSGPDSHTIQELPLPLDSQPVIFDILMTTVNDPIFWGSTPCNLIELVTVLEEPIVSILMAEDTLFCCKEEHSIFALNTGEVL